MKLTIKHKETEVIIEDGYSDKYKTLFAYTGANKLLQESITTIMDSINKLNK